MHPPHISTTRPSRQPQGRQGYGNSTGHYPFTRVVHGVPLSLDSNAAATALPYTIELAVWSSSSRSIAIAPRGRGILVDILDSATLQQLQSLTVSREWVEYPRALAFSPDGRMLSCASYSGINSLVSTWDLQTGGPVSEVELPLWDDGVSGGDFYITYSMNGKIVGVLHRNSVIATISVVDIVSDVHTHDIDPGTLWTNDIWTHGNPFDLRPPRGRRLPSGKWDSRRELHNGRSRPFPSRTTQTKQEPLIRKRTSMSGKPSSFPSHAGLPLPAPHLDLQTNSWYGVLGIPYPCCMRPAPVGIRG